MLEIALHPCRYIMQGFLFAPKKERRHIGDRTKVYAKSNSAS